MRSVSPGNGHIDYTYDHSAVMRVSIRVRPRRAMIMQSDGNDLERLVAVDGTNVALPLEDLADHGIVGFPSVAFALEEYMVLYPESDLLAVLGGSKSFASALRDTFEH
jgi:hypothetical protein